MQVVLSTMLRECCRVYAELPSAITSIISGDGARHFHRPGVANLISIYPRLHDGSPAAYIRPDDVQLVVSDMDYELLRVKVRLDIARDGKIMLEYTLDDDCDQFALTKLQVCARVCGVLLVDLCVRIAAFNGRATNRFCRQHTLTAKNAGCIAIHPAGSHLVVSDSTCALLWVYGLPEMKLLTTLQIYRDRDGFPEGVGGMCFTDAGTLLVSNSSNWPCSLQHWTLEGSHITSYAIRDVRCVASRGDKIAVGTWSGVHVLNLKDVSMFSSSMFPGQTDFWMANYITAVAFVDAATLAVSNNDQRTINLYTLNGRLLKHVASGILSRSIAMCADDCLLATDHYRRCIRVFAPDGEELLFPTHLFQLRPHVVALCGARAYVLDLDEAFPPRICIFKAVRTKTKMTVKGNSLGLCTSLLLFAFSVAALRYCKW